MFTIPSEHFEFRHFRPHYLDVDTIFGDLRRECLHQHVVRNTILRKALPSVVSGYGKRSINLNKVVATFEKHIFLSQTLSHRNVPYSRHDIANVLLSWR